MTEIEKYLLIEKMDRQIKSCKEDIVDIYQEIKDLEAIRECLLGYRIVQIN